MPNMTEQQKNQMLKVLQDKGRVVIEEELPNDRNWVTASKNVYKMLNGTDFKGNDKEAAKAGIDIMSKFNYNLGLGTIPQSVKLESADHIQKASMLYLLDTYENKEPTKAGFGRALQEIFTDPTSLVGVTSVGAGFLARSGAKYAAKEGVRATLIKGLQSYMGSNTAMAATGGAFYGGAQNVAEQNIKIKAGAQKNINKTELATTSAIGAGVGGAIGKGVEVIAPYVAKGAKALGDGINYLTKEGEQAMAKEAK